MHSATILFALAAVAATATGNPVVGVVAKPLVGVVANPVVDIIARPAYKSSYGVSDKITGDQKSAVEVRDGDVTKGSYSLVQPDGVIRTVNYIVTPLGGFQAQVINKGVAGHPAVLGVGKGLIGGVNLAAPGLGWGASSVVGSGLGLGVNTLGLGLGSLGWGSALSTVGLNNVALNGLGLKAGVIG